MSHSGDPEEEVIVLEEPSGEETGPRVVRVPRVPTQKEIDAHAATHLPHEEWCDSCMSGRARNKPHKAKRSGEDPPPGNHDKDPEGAGPLAVRYPKGLRLRTVEPLAVRCLRS